MHKKTGFSLIELMVVIAIVGVLAALSVPMYQNYIFRAKIATVIKVFEALKEESFGYAAQYGGLPDVSDLSVYFGDIPNGGPDFFGSSNSPYATIDLAKDPVCSSYNTASATFISSLYPGNVLPWGVTDLYINMDTIYTATGILETQFFYYSSNVDVFPQWQNNFDDNGAAEAAFLATASCQ